MDKTALVTTDFTTGSRMLEMLDQSGLRLNLAMWLHVPEYEDWRFLPSSRRLDSVKPFKAYGLIHDALEQSGLPLEHTPPLLILKMTDPFVRALRGIFGKAKSVEGMRLGGQMIGGRFVDDAIVYRAE